ncbi:geranylgeranyl diphosphate synthase, type I [Saccharopolyspora flava]|uniref:Geranylgeranyl diphosphate synthase, type I n=2 Tax=Saccharopolyspora flava TaxID=95161 RepID=A0A1I6V2B6_9PSEU|nr:geranylgeranyl diphosphate synthase, type I [Saccharopolyspora flava]
MDSVQWSRDLFEPSMRRAISELPREMQRVCGYHLGYWDADGDATGDSSGKAVRPALVLLSAEAVGGAGSVAVPAAVAVELVHNFSLLHDDVLDRDAARRGRPTAWAAFGAGPAIMAGDALLSLAYRTLAGCGAEAVRVLHEATTALIEGETADLAFEDSPETPVSAVEAMACGKTGALIGGACELGALLGGASTEQRRDLRSFGEKLGLAFQHVDDLLGIWGDPEVTRKPVHADLRARKKSLPVVAALHSGTDAGRELAAVYASKDELPDTEIEQLALLVEKAGGRDWSRAEAERLVAESLTALRRAEFRPGAADRLDELAAMIVDREF